MSIATHGLKLERHRHGATVADLTPYTLQVREIHGRMPPFGGLDVDLDVPAAEWALLPAPGDWLVLRDARTNVALQVANVAPVEPGLNVAGARVETKVTQVSADTWFDYLERLNGLYEDWIDRYPHPKLVIETDDLDFVNEDEDRYEILSRIESRLFGLFPVEG